LRGRKRRQDRREQRQEDRQQFGRRGTATRYKMRQKLVSFGDDSWIENDQGEKAFKVDGKMLRVRVDLGGEPFEDQAARFKAMMARQ
jgi:hypothetical protein